MDKPIGTFECIKCHTECDGSELILNSSQAYTCANAICGGLVKKISNDPKLKK